MVSLELLHSWDSFRKHKDLECNAIHFDGKCNSFACRNSYDNYMVSSRMAFQEPSSGFHGLSQHSQSHHSSNLYIGISFCRTLKQLLDKHSTSSCIGPLNMYTFSWTSLKSHDELFGLFQSFVGLQQVESGCALSGKWLWSVGRCLLLANQASWLSREHSEDFDLSFLLESM